MQSHPPKERKQAVPKTEEADAMDIPNGFECPISADLMQDPVVAADGHSYERVAIEAWFKKGNKISPCTNTELEHTLLIPNHSLRKAIQDFLAKKKTTQKELSSLRLAAALLEPEPITRMSKLALSGDARVARVAPSPAPSSSSSPSFFQLALNFFLPAPFFSSFSSQPVARVPGDRDTFAASVVSAYRAGEKWYSLNNFRQALPLLQEAARYQYPPALLYLGLIHAEKGSGVPEDHKVVSTYYQQAGAHLAWFQTRAHKEDAEMQRLLGLCYEYGVGVDRNLREAIRWYQKAAKQGDAVAQANLGMCYERGKGIGIGIDIDLSEAVRWYRKAAEQGDATAQLLIGNCYHSGKGVAIDLREAVRWYQKAAEQGHAPSQFKLALCYATGEGVGKNLREAISCYQKSAEQGYSAAQFNLGVHYDKGEGVAQDQIQAVRWYRAAAEQGDVRGQCSLGASYGNGEGVTKDLAQAAHWFQLSAEQGDATAQANLEALTFLPPPDQKVSHASSPVLSVSSDFFKPRPKVDTKAQNLLKKVYQLVDEVYPPSMVKDRAAMLAKLKPYQDRQDSLTIADCSKLRKLRNKLKKVHAPMAAASAGL